jgi:repressor LexA
MKVRVQIQLMSSPTEGDLEDMFAAAEYLTNDQKSVFVYVMDDRKDTVVAEFTINKARQMDVVDDIARRFRFCVANYGHSTISFSNAPRKKDTQPKERYTPRQGQYLAFIHYYTRLHGRPPAEADIQRYFRTTPPSVHNMVKQLEKKGLIEKEPYQARSIRLLLSREELPDLE